MDDRDEPKTGISSGSRSTVFGLMHRDGLTLLRLSFTWLLRTGENEVFPFLVWTSFMNCMLLDEGGPLSSSTIELGSNYCLKVNAVRIDQQGEGGVHGNPMSSHQQRQLHTVCGIHINALLARTEGEREKSY